MPTQLRTQVRRDHLDSLTRANAVNALSELIWNALDADATLIRVRTKQTQLGAWDTLIVEDNGHGLPHAEALTVFESIGGSQKRNRFISPGQRSYHGKEGKGRYKALALGSHVCFQSTFVGNGQYQNFAIDLHREIIDRPIVHDAVVMEDGTNQTGFRVVITAINQNIVSQLFTAKSLSEIKEKFAIYSLTYPNFRLIMGDEELDFSGLIRNTENEDYQFKDNEDEEYDFNIQVVEWNFECSRKIYLCNRNGVSYRETPAGLRTGLPLSIVIRSPYIDKLHIENKLDVSDMDPLLNDAIATAKHLGRKYARERLHRRAQEFIDSLKRDEIYPYASEAADEVGRASRQVFDIVALQVNEFLPSFNDQDKKGKKLTLSLIKEALENDTDSLRKILADVIELPAAKRLELAELLDQTPLSNVIDTMKEVTNRLKFLRALEHLIYDQALSQNVLERRNLHKIVVQETWIFGDDYTYGADDISLKNLLRAHLEKLGRTDFEDIVQNSDNSGLTRIPDVCLWREFSSGHNGYFSNLVIELKRPTVDAGMTEYMQIMDYARSVNEDPRFSKAHHSWRFVLLVRDIKPEIEMWVKPKDRAYGHVFTGENIDVYVLRWSDIIGEARVKYEYIQNKLNINLTDNEECMSLLRDKYRQYLPNDFPTSFQS